MFLVKISFIRHYVDITSSRQVFETFEECEDYIMQFPRHIVQDWSICPLTEQNPIKCKKDVVLSGSKLNGVYKLEVRVNEF